MRSLNFRGTLITKNEYFLLINPFCNKIIKNKDHIGKFSFTYKTYPVFSTGYRIIMVNVSGTVAPGASLLLLPYVGVYLRIQSLRGTLVCRGTVVGNH